MTDSIRPEESQAPLCAQGHPWVKMKLVEETAEGKEYRCSSCSRTIIQRPPGVPDDRRPH